MGRPVRQIEITEADDLQLRELELNPYIHPKVRLRASILRLHRTGMTVQQLSAHFDRNHQAIHNDLTRFEQHGLAGLADQAPQPRPTSSLLKFGSFSWRNCKKTVSGTRPCSVRPYGSTLAYPSSVGDNFSLASSQTEKTNSQPHQA